MVTQRKRHLPPQVTTVAKQLLHHNIDNDDNNSKEQRRRKLRQYSTSTTIKFLMMSIIISCIIVSCCWNTSHYFFPRKQRHTTTRTVSLLFSNVFPSSNGIVQPRYKYKSRKPDHGDIDPYRPYYHRHYRNSDNHFNHDFSRHINAEDEEQYDEERRQFLYDIDDVPEEWAAAFDEHIEEYNSCQPTNWKNRIFPVCNTFHELNRNWGHDPFLGKGYYRAAWKIRDHTDEESYFVFKQLKLPEDDDDWPHLVHVESLFKIQREAIIMERLTASPRIVDIYGHCGTSILSEHMAGDISNQIIPNSGHGDQKELDALPHVPCNNNFTLQQKIDIALEMAESIADMHGYEGGVMVNGDIHPVQWLWSHQGTVKLNDFNNADLMDYDIELHEYCKLKRGVWGGMYRAPEEFFGTPQDEKIDVYAMGNNIYTLLTGLWPFYEHSRYTTINTKVKAGERPYVDPRYRNHSYVERRLVEIMERMWHHEPEDRPEIFEVVEFLRETKRTFELEQR